MKYCVSCGKPMEDTAAFCGACGTKAETVAAPAVPVQAETPSVTPVVTDAPKPRRNVKSMVFSIIGVALGGVSLLWAFLCLLTCWVPGVGFAYSLLGFMYAVPGIIFSCLSKAEADRGRAKAGKIMNIIAMALFGVAFVLSILALSFYGADMPSSFMDFLEWLD